MPIRRAFPGAAFDPEEIEVMATAFGETLRALKLVKHADPLTEVVAAEIIACASMGERNPTRIREVALASLAGRP